MVRVYRELGIDLCRGYGASFAQDDKETNEDSARRVSGLTSSIAGWLCRME